MGIPGSGKSYALVLKGLEALAAPRPRPVYANFGFIRENVYHYLRRRKQLEHREAVLRTDLIREIRDYAELLNVHDGVLLFDEAHMWLPSRQFDLIPVEVIAFWSQHRKVGVDVYLATQRYGSVDAIVRELVAFVYWARPAPFFLRLLLLPWSRGRKVLRYTSIMDESVGMVQRTTRSIYEGIARNSVVILDPLAAACYDTYAIFEPPIVRLQRELDPKKRAIFERMGLAWDASKVRGRRDKPRAVDGMPYLTMEDLAVAYREGRPAWQALRERWDAWVKSLREPASPSGSGPEPLPADGTVDWSRFTWGG
ncbi:zonular occludens toxin domain-containing protein [Thermus sp. LT1-2-5]|uniref:zonular occludens toxin domain-containing protein n=1 Tax=Thermus sp. LT1-2-5 TaxID=3026935 RepID=UPI0033656FC9